MEGTLVDKLFFALGVSSVAMIIVFSVLVILMLLIKAESFIFTLNKSKDKDIIEKSTIINEEEKVEDLVDEININKDLEVVAVITSALSAYLDVPTSQLNIKSIKRINRSSNWNRNIVE